MCPERELLSQVVDGEADADIQRDVTRHLSACASCRGQVESLRALARAVMNARGHAPASACPDAEYLMLYLTENLDPSAQSGVEEHLSRCGACLKELSYLSEDISADAVEGTALPAGQVQERVHRVLAYETRWIPFSSPAVRWVAAAAVMLIAVMIGFLLSMPPADNTVVQNPPPSENDGTVPPVPAQGYLLAAGYRIGDEEQVKVAYSEKWVGFGPSEGPPEIGVFERYAQSIMQVDRGMPVGMKRQYHAGKDEQGRDYCRGPYSYLRGKTVSVAWSPKGQTQFHCPDFERNKPWERDARFPAPVVFDEHFLFALPNQPVRVGDRWPVLDKKQITEALRKYSMASVGDVKDCRAMGTLSQVTPEGQAVIDLNVTFQGSQINGPRGALAGKLYYDVKKQKMQRVSLSSEKVPVRGYRYPGSAMFPVEDAVAVHLDIAYTHKAK